MESLFTQLEFWHWLTFAVVLIIMEIFSPGVFFMWLGISSACVGVILYLKPDLSWQNQLFVFAILSVASIAAWSLTRRFFPPQEADVAHLNRRAEQYIGRTFRLIEPIENGVGKIKVDDSSWRVHGVDTPIETPVKVTGVDGIVFDVEPILNDKA